ncbi:unnamed protein product [Litomosoides sigmodontis]|uniref:Domain of unknown function DB domain-containing protein n=1 Tax=Litomosoides sigmodontis TaxID=42156 RepID=A0A3P6TIE6_LITSI|nr:unnamed protein product [Litomosoides sigmodontis]
MTLQLSMWTNLCCSLLWTFKLAEGEFTQNNEQASERVIIDANNSFSNSNMIDVKVLDARKLNQLISFIDKTWILPDLGASQPTGSNFKYKETCVNIYQSRKDACQVMGYGTMCFNYCYEQGEELKFPCRNVADSAYCKNNSAFDSFLTQYQKDPCKARNYIRQMISRCYATAICDTQHGILNTTIIDGNNEEWEDNNGAPSSNLTASYRNQQKPSQVIQQELPEIQLTRPIPIWQLLLHRHKMTAATKSLPIVNATEDNRVAEVFSKEGLEKSSSLSSLKNMEITGANNSTDINIKSNWGRRREVFTDKTTPVKQIVSRKNQNEERAVESSLWLRRVLQQMEKSGLFETLMT